VPHPAGSETAFDLQPGSGVDRYVPLVDHLPDPSDERIRRHLPPCRVRHQIDQPVDTGCQGFEALHHPIEVRWNAGETPVLAAQHPLALLMDRHGRRLEGVFGGGPGTQGGVAHGADRLAIPVREDHCAEAVGGALLRRRQVEHGRLEVLLVDDRIEPLLESADLLKKLDQRSPAVEGRRARQPNLVHRLSQRRHRRRVQVGLDRLHGIDQAPRIGSIDGDHVPGAAPVGGRSGQELVDLDEDLLQLRQREPVQVAVERPSFVEPEDCQALPQLVDAPPPRVTRLVEGVDVVAELIPSFGESRPHRYIVLRVRRLK